VTKGGTVLWLGNMGSTKHVCGGRGEDLGGLSSQGEPPTLTRPQTCQIPPGLERGRGFILPGPGTRGQQHDCLSVSLNCVKEHLMIEHPGAGNFSRTSDIGKWDQGGYLLRSSDCVWSGVFPPARIVSPVAGMTRRVRGWVPPVFSLSLLGPKGGTGGLRYPPVPGASADACCERDWVLAGSDDFPLALVAPYYAGVARHTPGCWWVSFFPSVSGRPSSHDGATSNSESEWAGGVYFWWLHAKCFPVPKFPKRNKNRTTILVVSAGSVNDSFVKPGIWDGDCCMSWTCKIKTGHQ
jgi:hypothetical protein